MLEFKSLCYLQNHKTGSTFVDGFLRQFCKEPLLSYREHGVVRERVPGRFYFTNVREPLALYRSLFSYGLDGKGVVCYRLHRLGLGRFYQSGAGGFREWMEFVLAPGNARLLSNAYTPEIANTIGFMTWRFLRLACLGFEDEAPRLAGDEGALVGYVQTHFFMDAVLKQETLREDLRELVKGRLAHCINDMGAALEWLDRSPKVNASAATVDESSATSDAELFKRLVRKEGALYRNYYAETVTKMAARLAESAGEQGGNKGGQGVESR